MEHDRASELLARERTRIERELAIATSKSPDLGEPGEEGSEQLYEAGLDQARHEQLENELAAVARAEARLAAGTYGLSIESGQPIPDARLEVLPTAERTVEEDERTAI